jgi:serine protease inhibitor
VKALLEDLDGRTLEGRRGDPPRKAFELVVANRLFGLQGYPFRQEFLDLTGRNYGAGLQTVDFLKATEEARGIINGWVAKKTNDRIRDLLVHKTFVSVDEQGTEAAGAAALVAWGADGEEPVAFSADRPFLFLIRDEKTGSVLFLGRIADPR